MWVVLPAAEFYQPKHVAGPTPLLRFNYLFAVSSSDEKKAVLLDDSNVYPDFLFSAQIIHFFCLISSFLLS